MGGLSIKEFLVASSPMWVGGGEKKMCPLYDMDYTMRTESALKILKEFIKEIEKTRGPGDRGVSWFDFKGNKRWTTKQRKARKIGYALARLIGNSALEAEIVNGMLEFTRDYARQ